MINFAHIAPTSYLDLVKPYPVHLLLAHLIEEDTQYREFYARLKKENPSVVYHMDCSTFEMFKRGQPMYDSDKLMNMAKLVGADSIVMSDYPKESCSKTIEAAEKLIPIFKDAGFRTFFCPQSKLGDINDLLYGFDYAINNSDIDFIGISILSCPIALGVNETTHKDDNKDESYRMQRFLSRWAVFNILEKKGMLGPKTSKRFHCLGMTDGPKEIELLKPFHQHIFSWDSSSAVWHGINNRMYDDSPTGLRHGKYELEVDFDMEYIDRPNCIAYNMRVIDEMCKGL